MTVTLKIHLEPSGGADLGSVWWAESDDLPGFTAAADHLPELIDRAKASIEEQLGENVEIVQEMVFEGDEAQARAMTIPTDMGTAPAAMTRQQYRTDVLQDA